MAYLRLSLLALASFGVCLPIAAQDAPTFTALWEIVQRQQLEIEDLKRQVNAAQKQIEDAGEEIEATQNMVAAPADFVEAPIGRASCRERVSIAVVAGSLKKKTTRTKK